MDNKKESRIPAKSNLLMIVLHVLTIILLIFSFVLIKNYFSTKDKLEQIETKLDEFNEEQKEYNKITGDMLVNTNYYLGKLIGEEEEVIEEVLNVEFEKEPEIEEPAQIQEEEVEEQIPETSDSFISSETDNELLLSIVSVYAGENTGSGFIVTEYGHIVTNYHIVKDHKLLEIDFYDGTIALSKMIGFDKNNDIAIIKVIGKDMPYLNIGDSDTLKNNQPLAVLSMPLSSGTLINQGEISELGDFSFILNVQGLNGASSGGAIIDKTGNVVGMITNVADGNDHIAVYSNDIKQILDRNT